MKAISKSRQKAATKAAKQSAKRPAKRVVAPPSKVPTVDEANAVNHRISQPDQPDQPSTHQKRYEAALALLAELCTRYPNCFRPDDQPPLPLAIGVDEVLRDALGPGVAPRVLGFALRLYVGRVCYWRALMAPNAQRIDLDGNVTGPVTAEAASSALDSYRAYRAKRQAALPRRTHASLPN